MSESIYLQRRILRIVNEYEIAYRIPLTMKQLFSLEFLKYHYDVLEIEFIRSMSITRNRSAKDFEQSIFQAE